MGFFSKKKKDIEEKKEVKKTAVFQAAPTKAKLESDKKEPNKKSMKELYAGEEAAKPTATKKGKTVRKFKNAYQVLIKPLITEKAANMGAENKYVFEVSTKANKIEVAKAIEEVYGIKPVSVNMITKKGKNVQYGRISGKRKAWKKAIVALPQGKTINIYEGV